MLKKSLVIATLAAGVAATSCAAWRRASATASAAFQPNA